MKKLSALIMFIVMIITGCASMGQGGSQQSITGSWTGYTQRGDVLTLTFSEDGTVKGYMMAGFPTQFSASYIVNGATIDIFDFDKNEEAMSLLPYERDREQNRRTPDNPRYLGIMAFTDENTMQLTGGYESMGGRPSDFGDAVIELRR